MSRYNVAPRSIEDIVAHLGARVGLSDGHITGITQDSRQCQPGDLYCCVVGSTFDGHDFAADAVGRGATAVLVERELAALPDSIAQIVVPDVRRALGPLAQFLFGSVAGELRMIGVTGTNGKTSTCALLAAILRAAGEQCDVIGTLTGHHTTPEAIDLHAHLADCHRRGITTIVMEVSSHALAQHRVDGIVFDRAVFTNLGHDHLDFHGSLENYFAAKARLFTSELARLAIINADDPHGKQLIDRSGIDTVEYRWSDLTNVDIAGDHVAFQWRGQLITVNVGGRFTAMNALAALATAATLGVPDEALVRGCGAVTSIDGRFQHIPNSLGLDVVVDFAHTPEGLESLLRSAREVADGRLAVVFGCGGDRDPGKRAPMGKVAHSLADAVFVTSDNPRNEDPESIIAQICAGMSGDGAVVQTIVNRREAIESAISWAKRGDMVVIAGKGHERTQEIAGVFHPLYDADVAEAAFAEKARREKEAGA